MGTCGSWAWPRSLPLRDRCARGGTGTARAKARCPLSDGARVPQTGEGVGWGSRPRAERVRILLGFFPSFAHSHTHLICPYPPLMNPYPSGPFLDLPSVAIAVLVGLGLDYDIFLMDSPSFLLPPHLPPLSSFSLRLSSGSPPPSPLPSWSGSASTTISSS